MPSDLQPQRPVAVAEIESREFGSQVMHERNAYQQADTSRLPGFREARSAGVRISSQRNTVEEDPLYSQLTVSNYKKKFDRLIKAEKESHEGILRER